MYSLSLSCSPEDVDLLSGELWEAGTAGICEIEQSGHIVLIANFETNTHRSGLLQQFSAYRPEWTHEDAVDWIAETQRVWPPRSVGERLFLAPPWCEDPTPLGRERIIHNPGLACGTGEHPCTQLALMAIQKWLRPGDRVLDVGTGSGLLAIAAVRLGASIAAGIDPDEAALQTARENLVSNDLHGNLVAGSVDSIADSCSDLTVVNISGTVLLAIADDLLRVTATAGMLILTGFTEWELAAMQQIFPAGEITAVNEWRCISARLS